MATTDEGTTAAPSGDDTLDPAHSRIGFVVRHAMVSKVRGHFGSFSGSGSFDAGNPEESSLAITIDAASFDSGNADRDAHVRSGDFLDVEAFPQLTFVSTKVESRGAGEFAVTGDLTIKGITRSVTFDVELGGSVVDPWGHTRVGLEGRAVVSRKEWGLTWNAPLEAGGVIVSDKVTLEFEAEATRN